MLPPGTTQAEPPAYPRARGVPPAHTGSAALSLGPVRLGRHPVSLPGRQPWQVPVCLSPSPFAATRPPPFGIAAVWRCHGRGCSRGAERGWSCSCGSPTPPEPGPFAKQKGTIITVPHCSSPPAGTCPPAGLGQHLPSPCPGLRGALQQLLAAGEMPRGAADLPRVPRFLAVPRGEPGPHGDAVRCRPRFAQRDFGVLPGPRCGFLLPGSLWLRITISDCVCVWCWWKRRGGWAVSAFAKSTYFPRLCVGLRGAPRPSAPSVPVATVRDRSSARSDPAAPFGNRGEKQACSRLESPGPAGGSRGRGGRGWPSARGGHRDR